MTMTTTVTQMVTLTVQDPQLQPTGRQYNEKVSVGNQSFRTGCQQVTLIDLG